MITVGRTLRIAYCLSLVFCTSVAADGLCSGNCGFTLFSRPTQIHLNDPALTTRVDYKLRFDTELRPEALARLATCEHILGALQKASPKMEALFGVRDIAFGQGECRVQQSPFVVEVDARHFSVVVPFKSGWSSAYLRNSPGLPQGLGIAIQNDSRTTQYQAYRAKLEGDITAAWSSEFKRDLSLSVVVAIGVQAKPAAENDRSFSSVAKQIETPGKVAIRCLSYSALWDIYFPWLQSLAVDMGWGNIRPDKEQCNV